MKVGDKAEVSRSFSKEDLLDRFMPTFKNFNKRFEPDWIRNSWLFRTDYAQPVPLLNHSGNIPAIKTPVDGLYFYLPFILYFKKNS